MAIFPESSGSFANLCKAAMAALRVEPSLLSTLAYKARNTVSSPSGDIRARACAAAQPISASQSSSPLTKASTSSPSPGRAALLSHEKTARRIASSSSSASASSTARSRPSPCGEPAKVAARASSAAQRTSMSSSARTSISTSTTCGASSSDAETASTPNARAAAHLASLPELPPSLSNLNNAISVVLSPTRAASPKPSAAAACTAAVS
mmetsp:Transcript_121134/g.386883  ORF Transcript_121134/g.386883 Transcript_121134/m.386883 type:complete len:209 (+) Transcript_121134:76-702(+)